ncbi:MAG: hypothetical protein ABJD24_17910 [Acidimicrobiales bacterium]
MVRLLEETLVRVGNEEYARANGSFGLTSLRDRHVRDTATGMQLRFVGKSGKGHAVAVDDPRLARLVRRCQVLPGQVLFQYLDNDDSARPLRSPTSTTISGPRLVLTPLRRRSGPGRRR